MLVWTSITPRAHLADFARAWLTVMAELPATFTWTRAYERGAPSALEFLRRRCAAEWSGNAA